MEIDGLKGRWNELCGHYTTDTKIISDLWVEIASAYTALSRHYHSLQHLADLFTMLDKEDLLPERRRELGFSIFYHDIVYYVLHSDNERKSADIAKRRLRIFDAMTSGSLKRIQQAIIATKGHQKQQDEVIDLFLDMDISILAAPKEEYASYCLYVRREYAVIPDRIFRSGRIRILRYFLQKPQIYHLESSREKWEAAARANMQNELDGLLERT